MNPLDASPAPTASELRQQALALLREGCDPRDVADALQVDLSTLRQLVGECVGDCE